MRPSVTAATIADNAAPEPVAGHTPGPWAVGEPYRFGYDSGRTPITGSNAAVAIVDTSSRYLPGAANAQLIAAAPDLLAAVHRAAEYFAANQDDEIAADLLNEMRAVINNAEGRS
jgi:hypothetical protein